MPARPRPPSSSESVIGLATDSLSLGERALRPGRRRQAPRLRFAVMSVSRFTYEGGSGLTFEGSRTMRSHRRIERRRGVVGAGFLSQPRVSRRFIVAIVIGIALGATIPAATFGIGITHRGCAQGRVVGESGSVAVPLAIAIQPPGGLVYWSYSYTTYLGAVNYTTAGGPNGPINSTTYADVDYNWTAVAETPTTILGRGESVACPPIGLQPPTRSGGVALAARACQPPPQV